VPRRNRPSGGRGRRRPYSRISLAENEARIRRRVFVIHAQIDAAITSAVAAIPTPQANFVRRHLESLVSHEPSGRLREGRSPILEAELAYLRTLRPYNAWAWLLARLVDGPYVSGALLYRKRIRRAARALFRRLPPQGRHLRDPKAITERLLLDLYRPDGIRTLLTLREELKIGRRHLGKTPLAMLEEWPRGGGRQ
jgi:hypothetical protein